MQTQTLTSEAQLRLLTAANAIAPQTTMYTVALAIAPTPLLKFQGYSLRKGIVPAPQHLIWILPFSFLRGGC